MKTTDGPWRVVGGEKRFVIIADGKQIASCEIAESYLPSCRHLFETREQQEANARLIAASPDLLAACKAMLQPGKSPADIDAAYQLMRDAIARARREPR